MTRRLVTAAVLLAVGVGLVVFTAMSFVGSSPPTLTFTATPGQPVHLRVQTVGSIGFGPHPTWVSYLTQSPSGSWVHTTLWQVPAHTRIDVTLLQYDTGSPLRNQQLGLVTGVSDSTLNGRPYVLTNSNAGNGVGHTFSIPQLGINVPLVGVNPNASNICGAAPCQPSSIHNTLTFSFTTGDAGPIPGSVSSPAAWGSSSATGGRCRRSATWAA